MKLVIYEFVQGKLQDRMGNTLGARTKAILGNVSRAALDNTDLNGYAEQNSQHRS